jgi:hypothetical protein
VLISPISFREVDWASHQFHLALTKDRVRNSPDIEADRPVSRQHEMDYFRYYGYLSYWGDSGVWGMGTDPALLAAGPWSDLPPTNAGESGDPHLRSANVVRGYHVEGADDAIGHIDDFIVDDDTWEVRYLVVNTSNGWFGKKVLVAPRWSTRVSWLEGKVFVDLTRQEIKDSPEWDADAAINRAFEARLHDYYRRPAYWQDSEVPVAVVPGRLSRKYSA